MGVVSLKRVKYYVLLVALLGMALLIAGCGSTGDKLNTLKDDVVNITGQQVAIQLENSLNEAFPGVQVNVPQVLNSDGQVNWVQFKQTQLGNYTFFQVGDFEYRAVLEGEGLFKIERINHGTGETYAYAEFGVQRADGKFKVTAK